MKRHQLVDVVRGIAFCNMFVYHALWFATDAGLLHLDFESMGLHVWQRSIAGTFFFLVGVSLHLAAGVPTQRFLLRLGRVAGGAAIVTLASIVLDPDRIVRFGVLHAIFVCSVLGRFFVGRGQWLHALGVVIAVIGTSVSHPAFDSPWLAWTGFGTHVPVTFDHQPFVLWFGVVLMGIAAAQGAPESAWRWSAAWAEPFAFLGRHSLLLYMAHVPLLQGAVLLLEATTR